MTQHPADRSTPPPPPPPVTPPPGSTPGGDTPAGVPDLLERARRRLGEERPAPEAGPGSWMAAAIRGRWEAAVVSLVAAWTPVAAALWLLGMTLVFAVLAGVLLGSATPVGAVLIGVPLVVIPVLLSNLGTVVNIAVGGVLLGGIVALVLTRACLALEPAIVRFRGGRQLSEREARRILPLAEEVSRRLGLVSGPRLAIEDSPEPRAHTLPATIILSRGLVASMSDLQLSGVLAHELHHWQQGDAIADRFLLSCALPVAMTYRVFLFLGQLRGLTSVVAWLLFWPSVVLVRLVIEPATARGRRESEFQADAAAIRAGLSQGIYDALSQLGAANLEGSRSGWQLAMLHSHPPTELRLDAIRHVAPEVREAPYA